MAIKKRNSEEWSKKCRRLLDIWNTKYQAILKLDKNAGPKDSEKIVAMHAYLKKVNHAINLIYTSLPEGKYKGGLETDVEINNQLLGKIERIVERHRPKKFNKA
tara:strand:- start:272 stop:583 length:312 start_codon:yes stop_codon:yes gene_type:complete